MRQIAIMHFASYQESQIMLQCLPQVLFILYETNGLRYIVHKVYLLLLIINIDLHLFSV
jgi:hypothetical protein